MTLLFVGMYVVYVLIVLVCTSHVSLGPEAPDHISCMAMDGNAVWIASGMYVIKYIRGKEVRLPAVRMTSSPHFHYQSDSASNKPP